MTGPFNQEFVNKDLSCTVSSVSANVAEGFSVTLELGTAKAEEVVALVSFTIVATAAVVTTCSSPANCADDSNVQRECLHRDAVWMWKFHPRWCIRFLFGTV